MSSPYPRSRLSLASTHKPVRRVLSRSRTCFRGKFPGLKENRTIGHEGWVEGDVLVLFAMSPAIAAVTEQPLHIYFPNGSAICRYTPDFEVFLADGSGRSAFVEAKPLKYYEQEEVHSRLALVEAYLQREGEQLVVLTERSVQQEPRLDTLKSLRKYLPRTPLSHDAVYRALRRAISANVCTFGQLVSLLGWAPTVSLLTRGYAQFDLGKPRTDSTQIYLFEEPRHDWFFISQKHGF